MIRRGQYRSAAIAGKLPATIPRTPPSTPVTQLRARGLASATVHKRVGFARQFFQDAVDFERIAKNPFAKVKDANKFDEK